MGIIWITILRLVSVQVFLAGGWAVDAALGVQTRPHSDLDIVVQEKHIPVLRKYFKEHGYFDIPQDDPSTWNFVLGDNQGRQVDVHVVVFDENGNGLYGPQETGRRWTMFPADSLQGNGLIDGCHVKCTAPEYLVMWHTGYKLREKDYKDVSALCAHFGIEMPEEYRHPRPEPA